MALPSGTNWPFPGTNVPLFTLVPIIVPRENIYCIMQQSVVKSVWGLWPKLCPMVQVFVPWYKFYPLVQFFGPWSKFLSLGSSFLVQIFVPWSKFCDSSHKLKTLSSLINPLISLVVISQDSNDYYPGQLFLQSLVLVSVKVHWKNKGQLWDANFADKSSHFIKGCHSVLHVEITVL